MLNFKMSSCENETFDRCKIGGTEICILDRRFGSRAEGKCEAGEGSEREEESGSQAVL